jgi:hypothetical protein
VALKVCMNADTPSTMKKMVLLSQESSLYKVAVRVTA